MPVSKLKERDIRKIAYIGLGSNLGKRRENIEKALELLDYRKTIDIIMVSSLYDNEPYGYKDQPFFLNGVAKVSTSLRPTLLLKELKKIEKKMGRKVGKKWGPRIIDLDILFYDNIVFDNKELKIPHPESHKRWFVLKPMDDIDPNFFHPILKKTVHQLLEELDGSI